DTLGIADMETLPYKEVHEVEQSLCDVKLDLRKEVRNGDGDTRSEKVGKRKLT
ncbi:hypothetical protein HAX54_051297, partial [Datura stramonium]|nr:hypothetical protein [Datura stramonium]